jgi:uncharacterized protein (DUF305 family)
MKKAILVLGIFLASISAYADQVTEAEYMTKMSALLDEGIAMSKIAMGQTKNKKIKKIAEKIVKDEKEKKRFEKLRAKYYADVIVSETQSKTAEDSVALKSTGSQFDKDYLELMTKKHKEEILLTSKMLPGLERRSVHHMAVKLVKKKGNEIEKMEKIKSRL